MGLRGAERLWDRWMTEIVRGTRFAIPVVSHKETSFLAFIIQTCR